MELMDSTLFIDMYAVRIVPKDFEIIQYTQENLLQSLKDAKLALQTLSSDHDDVVIAKIKFTVVRPHEWLTSDVADLIRALFEELPKQHDHQGGQLAFSVGAGSSGPDPHGLYDKAIRTVLHATKDLDLPITEMVLGDGYHDGIGPGVFSDEMGLRFDKLERLSVRFRPNTDWNTVQWDRFQSCFASARNIEELHLDGDLRSSTKTVRLSDIQGVFDMRHLRGLKLTYWLGTQDEFDNLLLKLPALEELTLEECWIPGEGDWNYVILTVKAKKGPSIKLFACGLVRDLSGECTGVAGSYEMLNLEDHEHPEQYIVPHKDYW